MALLPENTPIVTDWEASEKPQRCLRLHEMTFASTEMRTDTITICTLVRCGSAKFDKTYECFQNMESIRSSEHNIPL